MLWNDPQAHGKDTAPMRSRPEGGIFFMIPQPWGRIIYQRHTSSFKERHYFLIRGHPYMTSAKFWDILTPPPLVCIWDWSRGLNSHNLTYYISFGLTPLPPQCGCHIWMPPWEKCKKWSRKGENTARRGDGWMSNGTFVGGRGRNIPLSASFCTFWEKLTQALLAS